MKEDPNLIFVLKPITPRAVDVFGHEHNRKRLVPAPQTVAVSRGATPATNIGDNEDDDDGQGGITGDLDEENDEKGDFYSQLRFTFDQKPRDIQRGFVFGSNSDICDVLLGSSHTGISSVHFTITLDGQGRPVLRNTSQLAMAVSYNGQACEQKRLKFTWILFPEHLNKTIEVKSPQRHRRFMFPPLKFSIEIATHSSCEREYAKLFNSYLQESQNAIGAVGLLNFNSQDPTEIGTKSPAPSRGWICIKDKEIGHGAFGDVHRVLDVSTGCDYAAKEFRQGGWEKEVDIMKTVKHVRE